MRQDISCALETAEMIGDPTSSPALAEPSASGDRSDGAPTTVTESDLTIRSYMKNHWLTEGVEIDPRRSEIYNNALRILHVMVPTLEMEERPFRYDLYGFHPSTLTSLA